MYEVIVNQINKSSRALNSSIWHLLQHLQTLGLFVSLLIFFFKLTSWEQTLSDADCDLLISLCVTVSALWKLTDTVECSGATRSSGGSVEQCMPHFEADRQNTTKKKLGGAFWAFCKSVKKMTTNIWFLLTRRVSAEQQKRDWTGSECEMKVPSSGCVVG